MPSDKWYEQYETLRQEVQELQEAFVNRCQELGLDKDDLEAAFREDLIALAVHESNKQEGLYLDIPSTRQLTKEAFSNFSLSRGKDLDLNALTERHRREVIKRRRKGATNEQIATYNLAIAYQAVHWISETLFFQETADYYHAMLAFINRDGSKDWSATEAILERYPELAQLLAEIPHETVELTKRTESINLPITGITTEGEMWHHLLNEADVTGTARSKMRLEYIHFLHRITVMGLLPPKHCGHYRDFSVHIGDPDVLFAPASFISPLMEHFIATFPRVILLEPDNDPIMNAAKASYSFAIIHPYADGNGRVSRLIMNLMLWREYLPLQIKADSKGRKRYRFALKRAYRGNLAPLACLIALHLKETYIKVLNTVNAAVVHFNKNPNQSQS